MRFPRALIASIAVALTLPLAVPTVAQEPPDLTGTWELTAEIFVVVPQLGEEPCSYVGEVFLSQEGEDWLGEPELTLESGPQECPAEMMGNLVGTLVDEEGEFLFHGTIMDGQLGEASYEGRIFSDAGLQGEFDLVVESGPFQGATGSCLAVHQGTPPEADLAITHVATVEDTTVSFAVEVENLGPSDATATQVVAQLPECTEFTSDDCGGSESGGEWTWPIGALASASSASCTVEVDASGCAGEGEQTSTASVTAKEPDPEPDNDSADATFEIAEPTLEADLALSQVATVNAAAATTQDDDTPRAAANGEVTVDLALEVTNAGPDDATGVVVTNELPECTEVLSDDCGGAAGPPWTWTIGDLASGASASCNLTVDASECSGTQTATGLVSADTSDPDPDDNTAEVTFEIGDVPALPALALAVLAAALAWVAMRRLRRERATESPLGR